MGGGPGGALGGLWSGSPCFSPPPRHWTGLRWLPESCGPPRVRQAFAGRLAAGHCRGCRVELVLAACRAVASSPAWKLPLGWQHCERHVAAGWAGVDSLRQSLGDRAGLADAARARPDVEHLEAPGAGSDLEPGPAAGSGARVRHAARASLLLSVQLR